MWCNDYVWSEGTVVMAMKRQALHLGATKKKISTTHTASYGTHDSPSSVFGFFDDDETTTIGTA